MITWILALLNLSVAVITVKIQTTTNNLLALGIYPHEL